MKRLGGTKMRLVSQAQQSPDCCQCVRVHRQNSVAFDLTMGRHVHLHQLTGECTLFKIVQKCAANCFVPFMDASCFMMGVYNGLTVTKEGVLSEVEAPWRLSSMHCLPQFRSLWMWSTGVRPFVQNCGWHVKLRSAPQTFAQLSATSMHFVALLL